MTKGSRLGTLARAVLRTQTDERLVALAREGREAAFEEIVRRYRPGLVAFAAAYAPSDRVEDVVQESLVRAWKALAQASEETHLKPWLYTIVRNRALNARRDAKTHAQLSEQIDGVPQPPELVMNRAELAAVVGAVNALPEPQREALVRSAVEGHTHDQIAEALGSSVGAVRQLIYRARLNLRTGLGLMVPLPLVRMLAEHGTETAVAAGGAALGAAGGASALTKVATLAAIGTVAAGAGVAIDRGSDDRVGARQQIEQRRDHAGRSFEATTIAAGSGAQPGAAGGDDGRGGAPVAGDDSGQGSDDSGGSGGDSGPSADSGSGGSDDSSGAADPSQEGSSGDDGGSDHSGPGPSDGGDHGLDGSGGDSSGSSGSGSSGSGSSGSGSSGSGSSGSGSSGSGSGSDSSGPGPGGGLLDSLEDDHSGPGGGIDDPPELPEPPDLN